MGNIMNSIWFGEKSTKNISDIKDCILQSDTETKVILNLIELFKIGDFTQKPLLIQLMNQTKDDAVLNLCIRIFFSISTHDDLRNSNNFHLLNEATEETVNTFASAATTSLSLDVIPYLLALLEDWDEISDTSLILRDSIDSFINFEEHLGENVSVDEIGQYYVNISQEYDVDSYYFNKKLAFPGDLAKRLMERVLIAANNEEPLRMELIPSVLSIWTGVKVPAEYNTVINANNYKDFINYINVLSSKNWEKGQKYFYGHKL
ncbi:hypothetical protein D3C76_467650 [compost metagenome]